MDRSQEETLFQESRHDEGEPLPQESTGGDQFPQPPTLSDYGRKWITERPIFSPLSDWYNFPQPDMVSDDFFGLQTYGSNFPAMFSSGMPNLSNSANLSSGVDTNESNGDRRNEVTEVEKTHDSFSPDEPISPNWAMAAINSFFVDTGCEGIHDQSDSSSTFGDLFHEQNYSSKWPTPSDTPILSKSTIDSFASWFNTPNLSNSENLSFSVNPGEPNGDRRNEAPEVEETHDGVKATDAVIAPLNDTTKLPPSLKPTKEVKLPSSSFLNSTASLEKIEPMLVPYPDKMKSGIASAPQQAIVDGSFAGEVEAEIKSNRPNSNGGSEPVVNRFAIKKKLTRTDVRGCLCLNTKLVTKHILPFLLKDQQALIEGGVGVMIDFYNRESSVKYEMELLKLARRCEMRKGWRSSVVTDMKLEEGDTIGLYWDEVNSRFGFSVVHRLKQC